MSILIKSGRIVTAADDYFADIFIDGDKITQIGTRPRQVKADKAIDATDRLVIPGGIDSHTHLDMPFGGTTSADDFESGTKAAAFGGTTTHHRLRHPDQGRVDAEGPRDVARQGRGQSHHRLRLPHDRHRHARRAAAAR